MNKCLRERQQLLFQKMIFIFLSVKHIQNLPERCFACWIALCLWIESNPKVIWYTVYNTFWSWNNEKKKLKILFCLTNFIYFAKNLIKIHIFSALKNCTYFTRRVHSILISFYFLFFIVFVVNSKNHFPANHIKCFPLETQSVIELSISRVVSHCMSSTHYRP